MGGLGGILALHLLSLGLRCSTNACYNLPRWSCCAQRTCQLHSNRVYDDVTLHTVSALQLNMLATSPQNAPKGFHLGVNALGSTAKPRLSESQIYVPPGASTERSALISGRMHPVIGRARFLRHVRGMVRPRIAGQEKTHGRQAPTILSQI
jgi:hypothetical protein